MIELIDQIRSEISCCCSWTRYETIIGLLDQMEEKLIKEKKQEVNIFTSEKEAEKNDKSWHDIS